MHPSSKMQFRDRSLRSTPVDYHNKNSPHYERIRERSPPRPRLLIILTAT
ncbi:hypothetical protein [Tychonema sp. LEGE 07203]|nr:hypothetical protein [Tychonema sp. LEGE 07203]